MLFGTLYLYGGIVTDNTAELYGGGVLGSPSSVICLKGNPRVFGNIANDKEDSFDNLYLDGNEDNLSDCTAPIRLTGALTDGVQLGMTRWIRPDDNEHPYRQMIVPYGYNIKQSDLDRLCCGRLIESKELYADNMEKYVLIPYEGNIVMVLAVDVQLDKERLSFDDAGETAELTATERSDFK